MDPRAIPWEIVERHATRGPRYTSYPTAPHFREDFDRDQVEACWREERGAPGLSVYVHVPYCRRRCLYCGCHTQVLGDAPAGPLSRYVDDVLKEAELAAGLLPEGSGPAIQLALGGGTPTVLPPAEIRRLAQGIDDRWAPGPGAERSVEMDPRTAGDEVIAALREAGFNRVSLGIQELDEEVQQIVGRVQPLEMVEDVVARLRQGDDPPGINFDLIHGLPGQTTAGFGRTLSQVVALRPERLAVFGYAHVPWMRPHQEAMEGHPRPDTRERIEMLGQAWQAFTDAGYVPIGFDHFALPDDELSVALSRGTLHRNFMGYTTHRGLELIGLGESAISAVGPTYAQDRKTTEGWRAALDEGRMPWERARVLTGDDELRREVILDLSCNLQLDTASFEARHGEPLAERFADELARLAPMVDDGLLEIDADGLRVTDRGRFFVRNACMVFDRYLGQTAGDGDRARFSRTV